MRAAPVQTLAQKPVDFSPIRSRGAILFAVCIIPLPLDSCVADCYTRSLFTGFYGHHPHGKSDHMDDARFV
jgi:hypothetical protein